MRTDEDTPPWPSARLAPPRDLGHLGRRGHMRCGSFEAAVGGRERRKLVGAEADHCDAEGLEQLERPREIEEGLGTRADGDDARCGRCTGRSPLMSPEVADIAVDTADAAGREDRRCRRATASVSEAPTVVTPTGQRRAHRRPRDRGRRPCDRRPGSGATSSMPTRAAPSSTAVIAGTSPRSRSTMRRKACVEHFAVVGRRQSEGAIDGRLEGDDAAGPRPALPATSAPTMDRLGGGRSCARYRRRGGRGEGLDRGRARARIESSARPSVGLRRGPASAVSRAHVVS